VSSRLNFVKHSASVLEFKVAGKRGIIMTLELVSPKDIVGKEMGGKRRLYRSKEDKRKALEEKKRIARIRANEAIIKANDAFDEIEKKNIAREGKY
jgi:hypothetical protein